MKARGVRDGRDGASFAEDACAEGELGGGDGGPEGVDRAGDVDAEDVGEVGFYEEAGVAGVGVVGED